MKNLRKVLAIVLAMTLMLTFSVGAMAAGKTMMPISVNEFTKVSAATPQLEWGIDINQEHDMINSANAYRDFMVRFRLMGLGMSEVKSLQALGSSYNQIIQLSPAQLREMLPNFGFSGLRAAPSTFIRVTGCGAGESSTVYFHPNTGYEAGTWSDNGGTDVHTSIDSLAESVYGSSSGVTRFYHYWGHWTDANKTHQGVDMYKNDGDSIISAHSGEVVAVGTTGRVGIYNSDDSVTYFYAHMQEIPVGMGDTISVGDVIGYQGSEGANGSHLHFEVRSGKIDTMGLQNGNLNTKNPYNYM